MAHRPAVPLLLRADDREELVRLLRPISVRAGLVQRARIVPPAADRSASTEIAEKVRTTRTTVIAWRVRSDGAGLSGLPEHDRSGRRPGP